MGASNNRSDEMQSAIHSSVCGFSSYYSKSQKYEFIEKEDYTLANHGVDRPGFHGVWEVRFGEEDIDKRIEEVISHFDAVDVSFPWLVGLNTSPKNIGEHLLSHGLTSRPDIRGMAANLNDLKMVHPKPDGFEIKCVEDDEDLSIFFDLLCETSGWLKEMADRFMDISKDVNFKPDSESASFIGYHQDEPVSTSMIIMQNHVAGLWWVSTLEKMRGRGIGTAMSLEPMKYAHDMECHTGVLLATEMGYPLYSKLGFEEHDTAEAYLWLTEKFVASLEHN
jgi:GNAT superfamily N-acetyltransferase